MPFDRKDAETLWGSKKKANADTRRDLQMFKQAGLNAEHVTGDPAWDQFLTYIEAQIQTATKQREAVTASLNNSRLTDPNQIAAIRIEGFRLDEQIKALLWVIGMPAQIKKLGKVARERLDTEETEAA